MSDRRSRSLERGGFTALVALLLAPVIAQCLYRPFAHFLGSAGGASVGLSPGIPGVLTLLGVAAAIAWLVRWLYPRLPPAFDGLARRHKVLTALYVLCAMVSVVSTARVSIFMENPARVDMQALPGSKFVETHSCLTAYVRASTLVRQGVDNVYDDHWWYGSHGLPPLPAGVENPYHPFVLDNFNYPPPFLLLTTPLEPLDGDFFAQRALWFGLNGLLFALGLWIVARFIDGPGAHRALLLAPIFFGILPILIALQIGNFQIASTVLAVLAMVAFERGRAAAGGAVLAMTILSKISPGILGVVLLAQRRLRGALFTAGFGALFLVLAVLRFGMNPIKSFVRHALPRLNSGMAFPFIDSENGIRTNMSPFGFPFKLQHLGLDVGDPWQLARRIAHVYTLALILLALAAARRRPDLRDHRDRVVTWMALLVLAALQSPFAPGYVTMGLLWATTLLAVEVRGARGVIGLVLLWLLIVFVPPGLRTTDLAVQGMVQTVVVIGVCVWLIVRTNRRIA